MGKGNRGEWFFLFSGIACARVDAILSGLYPKWFGGGEKRKTNRIEQKVQLKSIAQSAQDIDKYWSDMIYTACNKDPGQMREVVKLDVIEFFGFMDNYMKGK